MLLPEHRNTGSSSLEDRIFFVKNISFSIYLLDNIVRELIPLNLYSYPRIYIHVKLIYN